MGEVDCDYKEYICGLSFFLLFCVLFVLSVVFRRLTESNGILAKWPSATPNRIMPRRGEYGEG